ncbi:AAA family ATPase [Rhodoferax sp. BLA1]|uniref:AAA family ATPase n=1 Tax=Rhodoferax sp. BLA1 TaxID=2576062 RepID=UPI0015D3FFFE|nr:AAA family ATPase [Rhodoferax sp. BLA1]
MHFRVQIESVRPIAALAFEIDLTRHGLLCIVGKNGAGKTTLAKALMNLGLADTFVRTSSEGIFDSSSTIRYMVNEDEYLFTYDSALRSLSSKKLIPTHLKKLIAVEMPAPHGQRFTFFRTLANADDEIRRAIVLKQYRRPTGIIEFLSNIYGERRFDNLVEVNFRGGVCCCIIQANQRYIREDYFSSGEYFLINLYRKILKKTSLVVIDEIDIALDANAQAHLANQLRQLCQQHHVTVMFTSHSLALMQTLDSSELHYLDRTETGEVLTPMSFNAVKSLLFGFKGWDRYILTEDKVLAQFLEYIINCYCSPVFFSYQIIHASGSGQAVGLMNRNIEYQFLGAPAQVISVLDGDQVRPNMPPRVHCIPLQDVEKALWEEYRQPDFLYSFEGGEKLDPKQLYKEYRRLRTLSPEEIFAMLCARHEVGIAQFSQVLRTFLCRPS